MTINWKGIKISDFGQVVTGKTPQTKRSELYGKKYPFITPTDLEYGSPLPQVERGLSEEGFLGQRNILLPPKSVCFTCIGATIGKMCITRKPSFTNQQINSIIINHDKYDYWFVYNLLRTQIKKIKRRASGAATPIINKTAFSNIEVSVPPLPIQRKIAGILSAYDGLIENNTCHIKILEDMAQLIYREWFVNFRYPGHENDKLVESELGMIPEGWGVKKLSELVDTQYGYTESAKEDRIGPKYVRGTDINKNSYIEWDSVPYCPINEEDLHKYKLSVGDIMVIRMADPGKVGIIEKEISAVFASYLIRLSIKSSKLSPYYLFYFLNSDHYQNYVTGASTGTTRKSASAGVLANISLVIPPDDIRMQCENQLSAIRNLMNNLIAQNSILRQTRDLLLPRLISGKIDVSELV